MDKKGLGILGMALSVGLTGCGNASMVSAVTHHQKSAPQSSRPTSTTQSSQSSQPVAIQWVRLPLRSNMGSPTLIDKISSSADGTGLVLQLASYSSAYMTKPAQHLVSWQIGSRSVESIAAGTTVIPNPSSAFRLMTTNYTKVAPKLMDGNTVATVTWPATIPLYVSGANPFGQPFQVDNKVIGQTGSWIWVALKGPSHPVGNLPHGVWGFRHWDRLVALNITNGQYRIFGLPWPHSETLTYPLWDQPPAFLASHNRVYIGIGDWIGEFPASPLRAGSATDHEGPSASLTTSRIHRALDVLNQSSWNAVNADAQFWNCYVMKDSSTSACPTGTGFPASTALSQSPTYFNHGSVGFSILWASQLPMPSVDSAVRTAAMSRLQQGLRASLEMAWIGNPSSQALRQKYSSGPPQPLPGYYRKNRLYWAKSSS